MPPRGPSNDTFDARGSATNARARDFASPGGMPFRGNSSSSKTYPLTRRFNVDAALASLPAIKPGGEALPPLVDGGKAARLEDEAARLRKLIDEKRGASRRAMREWEVLERGSQLAEERTRIVEDEVRGLVGESSGAAF